MSTSRIKNIIIMVLAVFNLFLLALWGLDSVEAKRAAEAEVSALRELLAEKGLEVSEDIDFDITAPQPCTVYRDEKKDNDLIDSFIDYSYREDMGGNVVFYSSGIGQARLRGTGEIVLIFDKDLPGITGDYAESASKYMKRKGLALFEDGAEISELGGSINLLLPCAYDGNCVYNSKIGFTISDGKLMMIDGTRVFDGERKVKNEEVIDSVSALMHFLDYTRSEGYICSKITGLEAGYFLNVAVSGESSLRPVWRISTNTGEVYINAVSGKAETMAAG